MLYRLIGRVMLGVAEEHDNEILQTCNYLHQPLPTLTD